MHLSKLDRAFQEALSAVGIQWVDPCCPDCEKNDFFLAFRRPTLLVSRQLNSSCKPSKEGAVLHKIQEKVKGEWLFDGADGFATYLHGITKAYRNLGYKPNKTLELIDHSTLGHALSLGDDASFSASWLRQNDRSASNPRHPINFSVLAALKKAIESRVISRINLLGCRTGCGEGQEVLRELREVFGDLPIFGTTHAVDENDFEETGFTPRPQDPPSLVRFEDKKIRCID